MLQNADNRKLLYYMGLFCAIGAVLCFRAGNRVIGGLSLAVSASFFALGWLATQYRHLHPK